MGKHPGESRKEKGRFSWQHRPNLEVPRRECKGQNCHTFPPGRALSQVQPAEALQTETVFPGQAIFGDPQAHMNLIFAA